MAIGSTRVPRFSLFLSVEVRSSPWGNFYLTQIGKESEHLVTQRNSEGIPIVNLSCNKCGKGVRVSERQILHQRGISSSIVDELSIFGSEDKMAAF